MFPPFAPLFSGALVSGPISSRVTGLDWWLRGAG
jgi:hypothetical protein